MNRWSRERQIRALAELIASGAADMATLATPFTTGGGFCQSESGEGRAGTGQCGRRCIFPVRRFPMPGIWRVAWSMMLGWRANPCFRHLGLYAYKAASLLEKFARPAGRPETRANREAGATPRARKRVHAIACDLTEDPTIGVDTPEDAREVRAVGSGERPCDGFHARKRKRSGRTT